ncbi:fungal-specific transcription factor domain-containing protein [Staphylotrichum tortipilum]|uniref:Fungal-specific transcription factor domain-containing protein n=1 Tax=Staphylotrichum tortipilum TaxID=2831512 RepID=A0AAN6RN87_9PEZI|nr:fungal-specific transcription factor domain-containing protein [Staphylotrichum longicolle]
MSDPAKGRRLPSSCVNCRRRKIKCEKPPSRSCRRCERLGLDCAVTDEALARPHYHTSKERFELMAAIIRHFSPATSMNVEDLRDLVAHLPDRNPSSWSPPAPEPSPLLSVVQPADNTAPEPTHAADDDTSPSVSDGDLSGAFISDATCQLRFDGAASYSALRSKVSSFITDRFPQLAVLQQDPTLDLGDDWPIPTSLGLSVGLPPRNVCERSSATFLSQINSLTYIVSPEKLFDFIDSVYTGRNQNPSVHAMVSLVVDLVNDSPPHTMVAQVQMETLIEEGSVESVQALILMALYRWKKSQRHSSWVVLGSAVRIAQSLGMHVRTENESLLWAEQKSRIWWSLYELDQWYSCSLGRPSAIAVDMSNAPPPSDYLTATTTTPPMYTPASARLAQFLDRAMKCIYLKQRCEGQDVGPLLRDLNTWWETLPDHLTNNAVPDSFANAAFYLRLRYHYILVLITRPFLFDATFVTHGTTNRYVEICEDHNNAAIDTLLEMQLRNLLAGSFWFDSHILTSSLILLMRIMMNPSSPELHRRARSMQGLLGINPGKIQSHASQCFDKVLEDINCPDDDGPGQSGLHLSLDWFTYPITDRVS